MLKYNRFGMKQERNLLLTTTQLANVKGHGKFTSNLLYDNSMQSSNVGSRLAR